MATQRYGVYSCTTCGAMTMTPDADVQDEHKGVADDREPLSRCALVYDTDAGEESCVGDVYFRGFVEVQL